MRITFAPLALLFCTATAYAESTRFYTYEGFANFLDGDAKSTVLTANGQVELGPPVTRVFEEKEGRVAATAAGDGRVAIAFATTGRLVVLDSSGKKTEYGEVPKGVVTSMHISSSGLLVATMSPLQLIRFSSPAKPELLAVPELAKRGPAAIWDMVQTKKGLVVVTGSPGSIWRMEGNRFVELFKSNEDILRSVTTDSHGTLYVGGGAKGIIYRGNDRGGFSALFDSGLDEITDMVAADSGELYMVGLSGAASRDVRGDRVAEKGKIRSSLVRVDADGFSDVLAGSDDEILYSVAFGAEGRVLVASGSVDKDNLRGRVYASIPKTREISLVHQTTSAQIVALLPNGKKLSIVANDPPSVEILGEGYVKEGEFTLPIFDAGIQSRFGSIELDGTESSKNQIVVRMRTGQVQTPDNTWSAWTKDLPVGIGASTLPAGRYVQAKLILKADGKGTPKARRMRIAYGRSNLAPFVADVSLLARNVQLTAVAAESTRERTVSLNEKGISDLKRLESFSAVSTDNVKARQQFVDGMLTVAWVAQDPNGDELLFDLYFKSEADKDFRLMKAGLEVPFYSFSALSLPDGRYQFRVLARDDLSNGPAESKRESRDSLWFTVDNSPPKISKIEVAGKKRLSFTAQDQQSVLVRAEYAVDGSPLRPIQSKDGLVDSREEHFDVSLPEGVAGPHVITVRLQDEAGNVASGETRY